MAACVECGERVEGCTVHDFKFDEQRTRIEWHFCPNCSVGLAVRLLRHALRPDEVKLLWERAGMETFMTHDDFYDEEGNALQPFG